MEHENIFERQHSCKWYFDEAYKFFDDCLIRSNDDEQYRELLDELKDIFSDKDGAIPESFCKSGSSLLKKHSFFPLFLFSKEEDKDELDPGERYERKKFEICKNLNAVDSIVERLCSNNVDSEAVDADGHVLGKDTVLKWLFTGAGSDAVVNQQNVDRTREFLRQTLIFWVKQMERHPYEDFKRGEILKRLSELGAEAKIEEALIEATNAAVVRTITDAHIAYEKLNGFRKYAVGHDLAKDRMLDPECLNKVLALSEALLNALLSCCVSYMRIDKLQLPRGNFKDSRLYFTNISDSNFASANFNDATLRNGSAKNCDFSMASLRNIDAENCDFTGSVFSYADFTDAKLDSANLSGAKIDSIQFGKKKNAQLKDTVDKISNAVKDAQASENLKQEKAQLKDEANRLTKDIALLADKYPVILKTEEIAAHIGKNDAFVADRKIKDTLEALNTDSHPDFGKEVVTGFADEGQNFSVDRPTYEKLRDYTIRAKQFLDKKGRNSLEALPKILMMKNATVDKALFPDADLSLVDLSASSFRGSVLDNLRLAHSTARGTSFGDAHIFGAKSYKTDFSDSSFASSMVINSTFTGCRGESINFDGAAFQESCFIGDSFKNYVGKIMKERPSVQYPDKLSFPEPEDLPSASDSDSWGNASFKHCNGTKALFACFDLSRAVFVETLFRSAIFFDINASSTMWNSADLTFAVLCGVIFNKGSMLGVSLQETVIVGCDFTCVNISNAKMLSSSITNSNFYDANMKNCNLSHSVIRHCVFRDTLLDGAIISNSTFENCTFANIEFDGISGLSRAKFKDCRFIDCTFNGSKIKPDSVKEGQHTIVIDRLALTSDSSEGILAKYSTQELDVEA